MTPPSPDLSHIRRALIVGPDGAPPRHLVMIHWAILRRDRAKRADYGRAVKEEANARA